MPVPWYINLLRLVIPLFIFKWPLWGTLASSLIDLKDWSLMNFGQPSDYIFYQNWDKAMDIYYLTFAFITTYGWKDKTIKQIAQILFVYRLIGVIIFWLSQKSIFLFIFPNFFESFFIFYMLYVFIFKKYEILISWSTVLILTFAVVIPKIIIEYFLHVIHKQIWEVFNVGEMIGLSGIQQSAANFYFQALLLFIIPFGLGLFFISRQRH